MHSEMRKSRNEYNRYGYQERKSNCGIWDVFLGNVKVGEVRQTRPYCPTYVAWLVNGTETELEEFDEVKDAFQCIRQAHKKYVAKTRPRKSSGEFLGVSATA